MRLVLGLTPSAIEFTEAKDGGPYPYLDKVDDLFLKARAGRALGIADTENASLGVTLNECDRRVAGIIGRPLRVAADVYDDDGSLYFAGTVSRVTYGATQIGLEIEA